MRGLARNFGVAMFIMGAGLSQTAAAGGCKVEVATNDFTGATEQVVQAKLPWPQLGSLKLVKTGDSIHLFLPLFVYASSDLGVAEGSVVQLKLEDGQMLELTPTAAVAPEVFPLGYAIVTRWAGEYPITVDQLKMLAASPIKAVNLPLVAQPRVIDMTDRATYANTVIAKNLPKAALCLASSAP